MTEDTPFTSVIIPTHNRMESVRRVLDSLCHQRCCPQQFEVLIVADGCTDGTVDMLHDYEAPFPLHIIEQAHQGPAIARNNGASRAVGHLLIFLDDDIEATPSLVEAHAYAHQRWPNHVVIGYLPPVLKNQTGFFLIALRNWWEAMFDAMRQPGHRYTYNDLLSGNFSIQTELFNRIGKFDRSFWCHEDYELGARLIKAGISFIFIPAAMGYHHENTDIKRSLHRKYQEGKADILLGRIHPELRSILPLIRLHLSSSTLGSLTCNLAFRFPALSNIVVTSLRHVLVVFEYARLYRRWLQLLDFLLAYSYWLGVATELGTQKRLAELVQDALNHRDENHFEIEIDLRDGLEAAERQVDEQRPSSIRIRYGQYFLGGIPPQQGAERLRGIHLRRILATDLSKPMLKVLALEGVIDVPFDMNRLLAISWHTLGMPSKDV